MPNFKHWMLAKYAEQDSPRGDLARDIHRDEDFPKGNSLVRIREHVRMRSGLPNILRLLDRCIADYTREVASYTIRKGVARVND